MSGYELQCCTCGAVHTLAAREVPDGPEALTNRGRDTWVDWEGIPPTAEFLKEIYSAIEGAHTFIFILTPDSIASKVCGMEIAHAVAQNKRMVPVVAREVNAEQDFRQKVRAAYETLKGQGLSISRDKAAVMRALCQLSCAPTVLARLLSPTFCQPLSRWSCSVRLSVNE